MTAAQRNRRSKQGTNEQTNKRTTAAEGGVTEGWMCACWVKAWGGGCGEGEWGWSKNKKGYKR